MEIPEKSSYLFDPSTRAFAVLATIMPDGTPQATPLWFSYDGELIWINTARGRVKDRNLQERPVVALAILDPKNAYEYIQVRGTVVEEREEGALEHIHQLSRSYTGHDYRLPSGQVRVMYGIRPESISGMD